MDTRFTPHNRQWESAEAFWREDPHLKQLQRQPLVYRSPLIDRLPRARPGIYTVTGGRQTGKTTLLKQWMGELLHAKLTPTALLFLTGELIDDHHSLVRLLTEVLPEMSADPLKMVVLDEVTYIRDWDKGIKYLADAGLLDDVALVITGSDTVILREARMRFPGRRGQADTVDFHLLPLSFAETFLLKKKISLPAMRTLLAEAQTPAPSLIEDLFVEFDRFLKHGGFLTAINDLERHGRILPATLTTYSDWIRGDVLKRGKSEHFLREIVGAIIKRYGSQITWNNLAKDLSIDHPKTVADYMALLSSMNAVFIQAALQEDTLGPAPKKARKVMFTDPFIFHAMHNWLHPCADPFAEQIEATLAAPTEKARLVEASAVTQVRRWHPTFYIKAKGEVDIAYVSKGRFWPIEIKWTGQFRPKDLQQTAKYQNSRVFGRQRGFGKINGMPTEPLPWALFRLGMEELDQQGSPGGNPVA